MANVTTLGVFHSYTPDDPKKAALKAQFGIGFYRNDAGDDLYALRDALPAGTLVLVTSGDGTTIVGAARTPFVPLPLDGQALWSCDDATSPDTAFVGGLVGEDGVSLTMAPPPIEYVSKEEIWRRLTADEATSAYADIQDAPAAFRGVYDAKLGFEIGSPEYQTLWALFQNRFGANRTAQILA